MSDIDWDKQELRLFNNIAKTNDKMVYIRLRSIYLSINGYTYEQISDVLGISKTSIANYVKKFREGRLNELSYRSSEGRPSKLSSDQMNGLAHSIKYRKPNNIQMWTIRDVIEFIKQEYKVIYSDRGVRYLLERIEVEKYVIDIRT